MQMNEQQFKEKYHKEQVTEEQKEWLEKEDQKTSEQMEVLTNSSIEMSPETDADLLGTSTTLEPIKQTPHLNEDLLLEPNGPQIIFQQIKRRTKEVMKRWMSENLNGPIDVNFPGPSQYEFLDQLNLDRVILLNQIDGILSLLPNHTRNSTIHPLYQKLPEKQ